MTGGVTVARTSGARQASANDAYRRSPHRGAELLRHSHPQASGRPLNEHVERLRPSQRIVDYRRLVLLCD